MQKTNRFLRSFSSTYSQPDLHSHTWLQLGKYLLLYFGTTTNTWLGQDFSLPTHREPFWTECVCTCICLCMEEFELTPKCCLSLGCDTLHSRDYWDSCSCVLHTTFHGNCLSVTVIFKCYLLPVQLFSQLIPCHIITCPKAQKPKVFTVLQWPVSDVQLYLIHPQAKNLPRHSTSNAKVLTGIFMIPNLVKAYQCTA